MQSNCLTDYTIESDVTVPLPGDYYAIEVTVTRKADNQIVDKYVRQYRENYWTAKTARRNLEAIAERCILQYV